MKHLFFTVVFVGGFGLLKSQSIIIYATEKIKGAEIPVIRKDFEVVINDSIKKKGTSRNDGSLPRIAVTKGKYKIMIAGDEFNEAIEKDVVVNEFRTTELTIFVNRKNENVTNGKKK
ncbi:MAG: hypothetical protein ACXVNM_07560 [Bacteroidia bacterium]